MSLSLDLDTLADGTGGQVTLDKTVHPVKAISAASLKLLRSATPETYLDVALVIAHRCVPTLSEEALGDLSVKQLEGILSVSTGDVEDVAKLSPDYVAPDPNGNGPATDPTSPA
jgi:hypothetical protein